MGQSTPITITTTLTVSNLTVESSDNTVVTVDDPPTTALAVGKGTATITVSGTVKGTRYTDTVTIKVRTPTGIVSGENYYIMNSGTEKFLSLVSAYDGNNVSIIGRDRSSSVLSQWTASNIRVDGTGLTQLISVYSNTDRKMYVSGTNLVLYNASGSSTQFAIHRIESGTNQGRYAMRYGNKYVAMDSSGDVYLTSSSSDNIYWCFMAINKENAGIYSHNYDYINDEGHTKNYNTTKNNYLFSSVFNSVGYSPNTFVNTTAEIAYSNLTRDNVFIFRGHANAGLIAFRDSNGDLTGRFYANTKMPYYNGYFMNNSLSNTTKQYLSDNSLANLRCAILLGCKTGDDYTYNNETYNLVKAFFDKGAHYVLGTTETVYSDSSDAWLELFLTKLDEENSTIAIASAYATNQLGAVYVGYTKEDGTDGQRLVDQYPIVTVGDGNQYLHY